MIFNNSELILITGASSGIGKAAALLCNENGARVIAVGRDNSRLQELKNMATYPENMLIEARDLSKDLESLVSWVTELKNKYGKFSGFVHSAGHGLLKPFKLFDLEDSRKMFDLHYSAAMLLTRGFSDRRNCEKQASIVYISSRATEPSSGGLSIYSAAKGALEASMKNIATELSSQGIRLNCISPEHVRTPMVEDYFTNFLKDGIDNAHKLFPLGIIEAEDIANAIVFLLSSASTKITGQIIPITGGKV